MNFTLTKDAAKLAVSGLSIGAILMLSAQSAQAVRTYGGGFHPPVRAGGMHTVPHGNNAFHSGTMHNFDNHSWTNHSVRNDVARRDNWNRTNGRNFDRRPEMSNLRHDQFGSTRNRNFDRQPNMANLRRDDLARRPEFDRLRNHNFDRQAGADNHRNDYLASRDNFGRMRGHHFDRHPNIDNGKPAFYQNKSHNTPDLAANGHSRNWPGVLRAPDRNPNRVISKANQNPINAGTGIHSGSYFKIGQ